MSNVFEIKNARPAPKGERSSMDTLELTLEQVNSWKVPSFQRPLHINAKIQKLAVEIRGDGVVPGVVTLGQINNTGPLWIVDAQHRLEAFKMSGLKTVLADVRIVHFASMGEMALEFTTLNTALVRMRPDDLLRALEGTTPSLQRIREECTFVGYDQVRRNNGSSPILGMGVVIKCWQCSSMETPVAHLSGRTAATVAIEMPDLETQTLVRFLHLAFAAWGRDEEYFRLWQILNLTVSMWLYRRLVIDRTRGLKRIAILSDTQFKQCLLSLSADRAYLDYLVGRTMSERDRSPCFDRMKKVFVKRLRTEGIGNPLLPAPAWAKG